MKPTFALFLICFGIYAITNYGGVRAPDSEVVFRVAESLADNQTFTPRDLERWPGFGVSPGIDGRLYSVYPPMESFVLVPVIKLAQWINKSGWYEHVPVPLSLYPGNGLKSFIGKATETHWEPHALRYIASWFDVLVSVLEYTGNHAKEVKDVVTKADQATVDLIKSGAGKIQRGVTYDLAAEPDPIRMLIRETVPYTDANGRRRQRPTGNLNWLENIKHSNHFVPVKLSTVPRTYIFPAELANVAQKLQEHGIIVKKTEKKVASFMGNWEKE